MGTADYCECGSQAISRSVLLPSEHLQMFPKIDCAGKETHTHTHTAMTTESHQDTVTGQERHAGAQMRNENKFIKNC